MRKRGWLNSASSNQMVNDPALSVSVRRSSSHARELTRLLLELGLEQPIASGSGFSVCAAGAGFVEVTPVSGAPTTALGFRAEAPEVAARELEAAGIEVTRITGEFGDEFAIAAPLTGARFPLDSATFMTRTAAPDPRLRLSAVLATEAPEVQAAWFEALGFERAPGAAPGWLPLASRAGGTIGLHGTDVTLREGEVRLGFETTEPLPELHERLLASGIMAMLVGGPVPAVHLEDPDGGRIEVHAVQIS